MICWIHQPNYIPYIGLFQKINESDIFIFYDNAQYTKWDYHNRNKIKWSNWEILLTIPVNVSLWDTINSVTYDWRVLSKHLKSIDQSYKKSEFYEDFFPVLKEIFEYNTGSLSEFNINFIKEISQYIWINTEFRTLSEMDFKLDSSSTDALVDICKLVWADEYISWSWWKEYVEVDKFTSEWIKLSFQDFTHPEYKQLWWEFIPYMSIIDIIFNEWKRAINFLN
jgi:hypothetical protein